MTDPRARNREWPAWARTWYGYLLRFVIAIWGIVTGFFLVLIGYYTAVDWKTGESDWTLAAGAVIVTGIVLGIYCLVGAIRPTRATFMPPLILTGISLLGLILLAIAELARNLS
ncbi:MAG: hypothetical protein WD274_06575 [Acidimicrobiia bacterium]